MIIFKFTSQWRRQHGFDGFGRTHQFFERGSRTHQIFGMEGEKTGTFWGPNKTFKSNFQG